MVVKYFWQDGGSLDLILKKSGRLPEPIMGMISIAVCYWYYTVFLLSVSCRHHIRLLSLLPLMLEMLGVDGPDISTGMHSCCDNNIQDKSKNSPLRLLPISQIWLGISTQNFTHLFYVFSHVSVPNKIGLTSTTP